MSKANLQASATMSSSTSERPESKTGAMWASDNTSKRVLLVLCSSSSDDVSSQQAHMAEREREGPVVETLAQDWSSVDREMQYECAGCHQRTYASVKCQSAVKEREREERGERERREREKERKREEGGREGRREGGKEGEVLGGLLAACHPLCVASVPIALVSTFFFRV